MPFIDLKYRFKIPYIPPIIKAWKGISNALRSTCLFTSHRSFTHVNFSVMCKTLSGKLQSKKLHLSRSISMYGLRASDFSRKSARHRILPQSPKEQTLSYGYPGHRFPQYFGKRQQGARLENLCRFCSSAYSNSTSFIHRRRIRFRIRKYSLRFGFFNHRPLLECFSLGSFSKNKGGHQTAYSIGSARQHSDIHPYHRRKASRREYSGYPCDRTRKLLCHGSGLFGLLAAIYNAPKFRLLRYPRQIQSKISPNLFTSDRQKHWFEMRSNHTADWLLHCQRLPGKTQTHKVLRFKERKNLCVSYEQLCSAANNNNRNLSMPVVSGVIL